MTHRARAAVELDHRAGNDELAPVDARRAQQLEEHRLVGEDVRRIPVDVVHRREIAVEEGGRSGAREHVRGIDPLDVLPGPGHLVHALLAGEARLELRGEVVSDRVPDRAGELHDLRVERAERTQHVRVAGPGVVLVEDRGRVPSSRTTRESPSGPSAGDVNARIVTDRPSRSTGSPWRVCTKCSKPRARELPLQERHPERGEQHLRALVDVPGQPLRIEVIAVQVRDVEVVGRREAGGIEAVVAREGEPRPEVRGREPRVAQDRAGPGLHVEAHMAEEGQTHHIHCDQSRAPIADRTAPDDGRARGLRAL